MSLEKLRSLPEFAGASDAEILGALSKTAGVPLYDVAAAFGQDSGGKWGSRLAASVDSYQGNLYGLAEAVTGTDWAKRGRARNEADSDLSRAIAQERGAISSYKDVNSFGDAADYVGGLAIDSLPYMGEALVGGLTGGSSVVAGNLARAGLTRAASRTLGGVAASYPSAVGDILSSQREAGGEMDLGSALVGGVPYAAMNAFGLEGAVARGGLTRTGIRTLDNMTGVRGGLARMGVNGAVGAFGEGVGETGQEVVNQYFGRMAVDPNAALDDPDAIERYKESFIGGAALGGTVNAAAGGWRRSEGYKPLPVEDNTQKGLSTDLLNDGPPRQLGYSPLAGTPTVFPDGTVALNGEQELAARFGLTPDTPAFGNLPSAPVTDAATSAAPQQTAPVAQDTTPVVDPRAEETAAAEALLAKWSVKPSPKRNEVAARIIAENLQDEVADQISTMLANGHRYGDMMRVIDKAIAERDAAKPAAQAQPQVAVSDQARQSWDAMRATMPAMPAIETLNPAQVAELNEVVDKGWFTLAAADTIVKRANEAPKTPTNNKSNTFETEEDLAFRRALPEKLQALPEADRELLQDWLGLEYDGNGEPILREEGGLSYTQLGARLIDEKTGKLGVSKQAVEKRVKKALVAAGAPEGISRQRLYERLGFQVAGTDLETMGRNMDVATQAETDSFGQGAGFDDVAETTRAAEEAVNAEAIAIDPTAADSVQEVKQETAPKEMRFARENGDDDVGTTEEGTTDTAPDALLENRTAEETGPGTLRGYLKDDLADGRVLESDIAEAEYALDVVVGRGPGAFLSKSISLQAEAVRQYARIRAAGTDPVVQQIKKGLNDANQKRRVQPAASDRQAVQSGTGAVQPDAVQDGARGNGGNGQAQPEVRKTAGAAPAVKVKRKRWAINKDVLAPDIKSTAVNKDVLDDNPDLVINRDVLGGNTLASMGSGTAMEFEDVGTYVEGVDDIAAQFAKAGIPNALDHVAEWKVFSDASEIAAHGEIVPEYGAYTVRLNVDKLENTEYAAEVARHEVGHAVDMAPHGGIYSSHPLMRAEIVSGKVVGRGAVSAELIRLADRDADFAEFLEYPLDMAKYGTQLQKGTPDEVRSRIAQELFAQAFTLYTASDRHRTWFMAKLPITANFMKEVLADVKTAKRLQVRTREIAGRRAQSFQTRVSSQGSAGGQTSVYSENRAGGDRTLAARGSGQAAKLGPVGNDFIDKLPDWMQSMATTGAYNAKKALTAVMFTRDLLTQAEKVLKPAKAYLAALDKSQVVKQKLERQAAAILEDFSKLNKVEKGTGPLSVNSLIKESTEKKVWLFKPDWVPGVVVDENNPAVKRFNAMSDEAQKVIIGVFRHGHDSLESLQKAVVENTTSEFDATIKLLRDQGKVKEADELVKAKAKSLTEFRELLAMRSGWPYAPLRRFGKFAVVGRSDAYKAAVAAGDAKLIKQLESDSNHYYVDFAESMGQARAIQKDIAATFGMENTERFERTPDDAGLFGGRDMLAALSKIRRTIEAGSELPMAEGTQKQMDKVRDNMRQLVSQLYLTALAENSARKGELARRTVAGANKDMMKAFASQAMATAHFTASLTNGAEMEKHLTDMRREAREGKGDRETKQRYLNEILRRRAVDLDYQETPLTDKAMAFTSTYLLTTNPSYFLLNATQPWMMSLPMIGGRHGYFKSAAMLTKSYGEVAKMLKNAKFDEADYSALPEDVRSAVEALADRGVINISLESEMGKFESETGKVTDAFAYANRKIRWATQSVESLNRVTTAIVAYRTERDARLAKGDSKEQAHAAGIEFADKVIYETHGNYAGYNAPTFMRSGFGRLATQFRKFQLIQVAMYARLLKQAFKDADPDERAVAQKTLMINLGTLFAAAGTVGMPGFAAISFLLGAIDGDEPDDPEATLRRAFEAAGMPPAMIDFVTKGGFEALGLGTVSGRIGAGGMLSLLPYTDIEMSREGYANILMGFAGPLLGGVLPRMVDGVGKVADGDVWKGMEMLAPTGISNFSKAIRYQAEGLTKNNGDVSLAPEDISFLASVAQGIGLPTTTITDRNFLNSAQFKADTFYKERTASLKKAYSEAARAGDTAEMREVREKWLETQAARKALGYKVQPISELLKAPQEQRKRERESVGGVQVRDSNEGFTRRMAETM